MLLVSRLEEFGFQSIALRTEMFLALRHLIMQLCCLEGGSRARAEVSDALQPLQKNAKLWSFQQSTLSPSLVLAELLLLQSAASQQTFASELVGSKIFSLDKKLARDEYLLISPAYGELINLVEYLMVLVLQFQAPEWKVSWCRYYALPALCLVDPCIYRTCSNVL